MLQLSLKPRLSTWIQTSNFFLIAFINKNNSRFKLWTGVCFKFHCQILDGKIIYMSKTDPSHAILLENKND